MFFLQEFDTKIKDNNGVENLVADHFSRIEGHVDPFPVMDNIHNERLMHLHSLHVTPWFADNVNFIVAFFVPPHASRSQIDNLKCNAKYYVSDNPYLWRFSSDQVIHKFVLDHECNALKFR